MQQCNTRTSLQAYDTSQTGRMVLTCLMEYLSKPKGRTGWAEIEDQPEDKLRQMLEKWQEFFADLGQTGMEHMAGTETHRTNTLACNPAFVSELIESVSRDTVEDGFDHPAEDIIKRALENQEEETSLWLRTLVSGDRSGSLIAPVVQCTGRVVEEACPRWALDLFHEALSHDDPEVREAAVVALEGCEADEAIAILEKHEETEPWLKSYIQKILQHGEVS